MSGELFVHEVDETKQDSESSERQTDIVTFMDNKHVDDDVAD